MNKPPAKKKARLYREEIKDRHTNHWDLDMASREELENLMSVGKSATESDAGQAAEVNDGVAGSKQGK